MARIITRSAARMKLLSVLPRVVLDGLIGTADRPWTMTRREAEAFVRERWSDEMADDVRAHIDVLFSKARGK